MKKNVQLNDSFSGIFDFNLIQKNLASYHEKLHQKFKDKTLGFYDLPDQSSFLELLPSKLNFIRDHFETMIVLGIGGSALGPKALIEALCGIYQRRVLVVDFLDPFAFTQLLETINLKTSLFTFISKSGETTETLSQLFVLYPLLKKKLGATWKKHFLIITDPEKGFLRQFANEQALLSFEVPPNVGGRFSVLSSVGLVPAYFAGIPLEELLKGAQQMRQACSLCNLEKNPAYRLASLLYLFYHLQKRNIVVLMPYAESLFSIAGWFAQLWGESIGKKMSGSTPVAASGPKDQHSQLQLYMEGPQDKLLVFLEVEKFKQEIKIENSEIIPDRFQYLTQHSFAKVMNVELQATQQALAEAERPSLKIMLPEQNASYLGGLFFLLEMSTAFAGELFQVNAFDQPGVEAGKKITREILSQ
ncbi:MAG: glucose-6-phosphate isomerase [Deltaproteobacteria bacterium]|nr:glucose-6-phosphate isomerase [Deltaproteobacteria bacterium]